MNTDASQPVTADSGNYRLLLDRLHKVSLDERGARFVRRALTGQGLIAAVDADDLLELAMIARQHGLIEQAIAMYEQLHERFPECEAGWRLHLELLLLLGDRRAMVQVQARAARHVPQDVLQSWSTTVDEDGDISAGETDTDIIAPFQQLRREDEQIRLFMRIFRGREDAFARQWVNRREEKQGYVPVRRPMQASDVGEHLAGHRTYGIYLLDQESRVHTGVIDVDLISRLRPADQARKNRAAIRRETVYLHKRIATLAAEAGFCCLAEVSGGKGYHFWFPVRKPVPATAMRAALRGLVAGLAGDLDCFTLEIFPKQDKRTGKGFGNLVKLPLGIHRGTGKPSAFVMAADKSRNSQFDLLERLQPPDPEVFLKAAALQKKTQVVIHPRHAAWAEEYPELARLESCCAMLGQVIAMARSGKTLSLREEKVLLATLGHLPRARLLLHHLFAQLPEYNRPLLDYKISRIRGTVLGCKRIHSLLEHGGDLPCRFAGKGYPHPLRHLDDFAGESEPKKEKTENLDDALTCLKTAIRQVERFM